MSDPGKATLSQRIMYVTRVVNLVVIGTIPNSFWWIKLLCATYLAATWHDGRG